MGESEVKKEVSLKEQGNEFFKAGNYLKAAALYTQAIKKDPSNPTLYSNRAAAFLHLVKLQKALADAETTITLNPNWEKGYFRKGCVLEAMERYEEASAAFDIALKYNPQSSEVSKKIKKLSQLAKEKKRADEVQNLRSNIDMRKHMDILKSELAFESPETHGSLTFLRQYTEDSFSPAACLIAPKSIISYPQVWKGQGSRKWKHGQSDGFFVQFESPLVRKLWFSPSSNEKGQVLCRDPVALDISVHEVFPRIFKDT